ncbi:MAG: ABC transporter ATP-binding protein [Candidatus Omnitrophota bacterium]|nr:ABC transporter ATP-binding protein [Candidatus Omnitrophota bacterium]MBU2528458.1 ABC transporter ATP-binding protein [bacterium]MBU3929810.1 ABC transporter ATP-binding protein [bacterium]MBU4122609.1 ABC transporter ATP-binding protein [bacterium]
MITFENFSAGYTDDFVIRDISCRIEGGKIYALIGPNAAGKTTMLRSIIRDIPRAAGRILIDGNDTKSLSAAALAQKVSYAPSEINPAFNYSVSEFAAMGRFAVNRAFWETEEDIRSISGAIRDMGLESVADKPVAELSSGQKQSCLLAQIIAKDTDIILLDEPAAHLDISHRAVFFRKVLDLKNNAGKTFVITFHDLNDAINAADEFILFKEGAIIAVAEKNEITENLLSALYGTEVMISEFPDGRKAVLPLFSDGYKS